MVRSKTILVAFMMVGVSGPVARAQDNSGSSQNYLDQILRGTPAQREREKAIREDYREQHAKALESVSGGKRKKDLGVGPAE